MEGYKMVLGSRNHELFAASDGDECLTIFENVRNQDQVKSSPDSDSASTTAPQNLPKTPFDVVILDYRMPKKDGVQVAGHILSVEPEQRIIIASAYTQELIANDNDLTKKSINHKKIDMLQKPFEYRTFLRLIEGSP